MISNDERREIAARLRELADANEGYLGMGRGNRVLRDGEAILGTSGLASVADVLRRYADLIEPDERTCRMTKKGPEFVLAGWWECSECGPVYPPCNDEIAVWALQKCPRCGAKVVE